MCGWSRTGNGALRASDLADEVRLVNPRASLLSGFDAQVFGRRTENAAVSRTPGHAAEVKAWRVGHVRDAITRVTTREDVRAAISRLANTASKRPLLVCIDGLGGSGKSTLTRTIREVPEVSAVVEGDDFYGPEDDDWAGFTPEEGYDRFFDHERLAREVLRPLDRGAPSRYQRYDWENNILGDWLEVRPEGVVVVEGVYMLRPPLQKFWDLSIFVDTPWPVRLERQIARGENDEDAIKQWTDAEKYYERAVDPASVADLVVQGY